MVKWMLVQMIANNLLLKPMYLEPVAEQGLNTYSVRPRFIFYLCAVDCQKSLAK